MHLYSLSIVIPNILELLSQIPLVQICQKFYCKRDVKSKIVDHNLPPPPSPLTIFYMIAKIAYVGWPVGQPYFGFTRWHRIIWYIILIGYPPFINSFLSSCILSLSLSLSNSLIAFPAFSWTFVLTSWTPSPPSSPSSSNVHHAFKRVNMSVAC